LISPKPGVDPRVNELLIDQAPDITPDMALDERVKAYTGMFGEYIASPFRGANHSIHVPDGFAPHPYGTPRTGGVGRARAQVLTSSAPNLRTNYQAFLDAAFAVYGEDWLASEIQFAELDVRLTADLAEISGELDSNGVSAGPSAAAQSFMREATDFKAKSVTLGDDVKGMSPGEISGALKDLEALRDKLNYHPLDNRGAIARVNHAISELKDGQRNGRDDGHGSHGGGGFGGGGTGGVNKPGHNENGPGGRIGSHEPIVLDLDGDGIELIPRAFSTVAFDIDNDGYKERTAWTAPDDGLLVIDRGGPNGEGDGNIDKGEELAFAAITPEDDTDLEAIAKLYDKDANNRIGFSGATRSWSARRRSSASSTCAART
jgi:hypothetical protein